LASANEFRSAPETPAAKVLAVRELCKSYGAIVAVDRISFDVGRGEIVGLLGPNGAGKTTTINMILGVLEPDSGSIRIEELDIAAHRSRALERTNFTAVYAPLPGNLTVSQNLRIFGLIYGVENLTARIAELLEQFDLVRFRDVRCGALSSGEQTRVSLAKAMLNRPRLLLLDEPTASLDPAAARDIRSNIRELATKDGRGVLWTSHNMYEAEAVCDRVLFLSRGRILLEGDPKALPREHGKATLEELFIAVAREPLTLEGHCNDARAAHGSHRTALLLPAARKPRTRCAVVRLGGNRYRPVELH
jgi:ABC-2 type transport system ATP-binding protein